MTGAKAWWRLVGGEGAVCRLPQGEEGLSFLETVGAGEAAKKNPTLLVSWSCPVSSRNATGGK